MKKYLLFLMAAMLSTVVRGADGDTFTYLDINFKVISEENHTVAVDKNPEASGSISIPSEAVNGTSRYAVTEIIREAFANCNDLTSVAVPCSVTEIGKYTFFRCLTLTDIVVEEGNSNYASDNGVLLNRDKTTLIQCPGGKTEYNIPRTVTRIVDEAFNNCRSLSSVTIPNSVAEIGRSAFSDCRALTTVALPNSVTIIEPLTFAGCAALVSVIIPNSVTEIRSQAFGSCKSLETIYTLSPTPPTLAFFPFFRSGSVVYIPKGSLNEYSTAEGWSHFADFREMGALDISLSEQDIELKLGDTATVTATVTKDDDMTIESEEWSSSNPEVATVVGGVITAVAPGEATIYFTAVDGYGVPHTEMCKVTVDASIGVDTVIRDSAASVDLFNLQGVAVVRNASADEVGALAPGIYIMRQGKHVRKIYVK